jgi:hypothetical protein
VTVQDAEGCLWTCSAVHESYPDTDSTERHSRFQWRCALGCDAMQPDRKFRFLVPYPLGPIVPYWVARSSSSDSSRYISTAVAYFSTLKMETADIFLPDYTTSHPTRPQNLVKFFEQTVRF